MFISTPPHEQFFFHSPLSRLNLRLREGAGGKPARAAAAGDTAAKKRL